MDPIHRFFDPPEQSYFLFGPRGTGKSTWIHEKYGDQAAYVDLLQAEEFRALSANPERLRNIVAGAKGRRTIVLDEIQKIPPLLDEVHAMIEKDKRLQFILTGSSARKLRRTGANLLAGRALVRTMAPFMAAELGGRFDLRKALDTGTIPLVVGSANPEAVLNAYAATYLKEEVQAEGLVRNIGSFSRFMESMSFSHANVLNLSGIARDCQVGIKAAQGYLEILEDLLLSHRIPVFQKKAKRAMASHPKFYFFDTGVFRSLRPMGPLDEPEAVAGAALEGLVFQHLQAWIEYTGKNHTISYWRTRAGNEVDFVIYGPDEFCAIEVKNSDRIRGEDFNGLTAFGEDYPGARRILLHRGNRRTEKEGIQAIPCEDFLLALLPGKGLPS